MNQQLSLNDYVPSGAYPPTWSKKTIKFIATTDGYRWIDPVTGELLLHPEEGVHWKLPPRQVTTRVDDILQNPPAWIQ